MEKRPLGRTDIMISPIIMGTWQAGKSMWTGIDDRESIRAIEAAYDAGITTFDTAEVYGNGHSERILGKALKNVRHKVVIASKVFSNHLAYDQVIQACNRSLKNLGTDYLDLYQIHWPPGSFGHRKVPLEETMQALLDLLEEGKIRAIGVSNFDAAQLEEALELGPVVSLQPPYSLFWRMIEQETVPVCLRHELTILAYSPLAQGLLTGKFDAGHVFEKGDHRRANRLFQPELFNLALKALEELKPIAEAHGATLAQLALAWVIAQPRTCAIAGARSAEQATQNAAAARIRLSSEDLEAMDRISRTVTGKLDTNPILWQW